MFLSLNIWFWFEFLVSLIYIWFWLTWNAWFPASRLVLLNSGSFSCRILRSSSNRVWFDLVQISGQNRGGGSSKLARSRKRKVWGLTVWHTVPDTYNTIPHQMRPYLMKWYQIFVGTHCKGYLCRVSVGTHCIGYLCRVSRLGLTVGYLCLYIHLTRSSLHENSSCNYAPPVSSPSMLFSVIKTMSGLI